MSFQVLLYYKFVKIDNLAQVRKEHEALCRQLELKGRILLAPEGINGTVSGMVAQTQAYMDHLNMHPLFSGIEFKVDPSEGHAFHKLHVKLRRELVHLSKPEHILTPLEQSNAPYIEPKEMQELLREDNPNVVILDTRSDYEFKIGKFKNAIAFDIENFREFPEHLRELEYLKDKKIVTYCTGGIRCEKATILLMEQGFKDVVQLHGGIIRYGKETGGENFEGKCYVFDERIAVDVNTVNPKVIGRCVHCEKEAEHMMNCANADCNIQMILCSDCAEELQGCCSEPCMTAPKRRRFNGKGQYWKGVNSKDYVNNPTSSKQTTTHA